MAIPPKAGLGRELVNSYADYGGVSFSGPDLKIWTYFPNLNNDTQAVEWFNVQAITGSMASSLSAVEVVGKSNAAAHTRGNKTYAGSLIFTVTNNEPLKDLIGLSGKGHIDARPEYWSVDQLPPFNVVVQTQSELGHRSSRQSRPMGLLTKVYIGVKLIQTGETMSINDMYLEQSYTFTCTYISPYLPNFDLNGIDFKKLIPETLAEVDQISDKARQQLIFNNLETADIVSEINTKPIFTPVDNRSNIAINEPPVTIKPIKGGSLANAIQAVV